MIKDKLKEIREKSGMNKKEFAKYLEMKYTTYNNYETGAREPDSEFLIMFSKKFNISTDFILGLQKEEEILHSYKLKSSEYSMVEKYRELDSHGKKMVDFTLNEEWERSTAENKVVSMAVKEDTDYLAVKAAHAIEGASEEEKAHDEDIMKNF